MTFHRPNIEWNTVFVCREMAERCLGRLKNIAKEFDRFGSASYMHHDCRALARKAIHEKVRVVEEGLPDYFVDEKIS